MEADKNTGNTLHSTYCVLYNKSVCYIRLYRRETPMKKPSMSQLRAVNPDFFSTDWGDYGEIADHKIEREGGHFVLKLRTRHGTFPVYAIDNQLGLEFARHGW